MGLGCNAVGVTGCRIMPTRAEKLTAVHERDDAVQRTVPDAPGDGSGSAGARKQSSAGAGIDGGGLYGRGRNVSGVFSAQQEIEQGNRHAICIGDVRISTAAAEKNSERRSFGEDTACAFPCRDGCGTDGAAFMGAWRVAGEREKLIAVDFRRTGWSGAAVGNERSDFDRLFICAASQRTGDSGHFDAADAAECAWGCTGG